MRAVGWIRSEVELGSDLERPVFSRPLGDFSLVAAAVGIEKSPRETSNNRSAALHRQAGVANAVISIPMRA